MHGRFNGKQKATAFCILSMFVLGTAATTINVSPGGTHANLADYQWSQQPSTIISSTGNHAVTFSPCPRGLNPSDTHQWVYFVGGGGTGNAGFAEPVSTSGGTGTCSTGASSGTVYFNFAHTYTSATYTTSSASAGIREAINDGATDIYVPKRTWNLYQEAYVDQALHLHGADKHSSIIQLNLATQNGIHVNTANQVNIEHLTFQPSVTSTFNSQILIDTTTNYPSTIEDNYFLNCYICINDEVENGGHIENNDFTNFSYDGLILNNVNLIDAGNMNVFGNRFATSISSQAGIYFASGGGPRIIGNDFVSSANFQYCLYIDLALGFGNGGKEDQHVAGFLHRHGFNFVGITPIGKGVSAQIVRRIRERPLARLDIIHNRGQRCFHQARIHQQQHGRRRIDDVNG